jgi:hypothetical protein
LGGGDWGTVEVCAREGDVMLCCGVPTSLGGGSGKKTDFGVRFNFGGELVGSPLFGAHAPFFMTIFWGGKRGHAPFL